MLTQTLGAKLICMSRAKGLAVLNTEGIGFNLLLFMLVSNVDRAHKKQPEIRQFRITVYLLKGVNHHDSKYKVQIV